MLSTKHSIWCQCICATLDEINEDVSNWQHAKYVHVRDPGAQIDMSVLIYHNCVYQQQRHPETRWENGRHKKLSCKFVETTSKQSPQHINIFRFHFNKVRSNSLKFTRHVREQRKNQSFSVRANTNLSIQMSVLPSPAYVMKHTAANIQNMMLNVKYTIYEKLCSFACPGVQNARCTRALRWTQMVA